MQLGIVDHFCNKITRYMHIHNYGPFKFLTSFSFLFLWRERIFRIPGATEL